MAETSCISAMKAMANGAIPVTSRFSPSGAFSAAARARRVHCFPVRAAAMRLRSVLRRGCRASKRAGLLPSGGGCRQRSLMAPLPDRVRRAHGDDRGVRLGRCASHGGRDGAIEPPPSPALGRGSGMGSDCKRRACQVESGHEGLGAGALFVGRGRGGLERDVPRAVKTLTRRRLSSVGAVSWWGPGSRVWENL